MATTGAEFTHIDTESNDDASETLFINRRCCFCIPQFTSSNRSAGFNFWHKVPTDETTGGHGLWFRGVTAVLKLREWSEIVAGPKWKTFIRRFNRNKSSGGGGGGGFRQSKYQYDPLSYALNFDEGLGQNGDAEEEDDYRYRNFSSRYATVPVSVNSTVDLGKEGINLS